MSKILKIIGIVFLTITLHSCKTHPSDKLNGTWSNKEVGFTVTIDTKGKTYNGSAMGENFTRDFKLVKEENNVVTFTANGSTIVAVINSDKDITVTKQDGGLPIQLTKVDL